MPKEIEVTVAPEPNLVSAERPEPVEIVEDVNIVTSNESADDNQTDDPRSEIYKRHAENRAEDIAKQREEGVQLEGEAEEMPLESEKSSDILQPGDDQTSTPSDEDPLVEVVVFEHVRMVPQSKVDAAGGLQMYQMREAAYEQMRRNAARQQELDNREKLLDDRERQAPKPPAVPAMDQHTGQPPADLPSDDQTLEAMARRYQEAAYDGDDNAPSILAQMVKTAASTGEHFDQNAFRRQVTEEVLASQRNAKVVKARAALIEANPVLNKDRPDKFDHRLFQAVDDETDVIERHHPEWEPEQVLAEAWKKVSKWKGGHQTDTMQGKQRDKENLNRPSSGTQRFTPPPPEPRKTNSDYVREERKRRGLEV